MYYRHVTEMCYKLECDTIKCALIRDPSLFIVYLF